ncbi:MAG: hypothetical protein V4556_07625 [Bacteroidota bacterium]
MNNYTALYDQYDLLLPPKFDGGYLIITLDEKIKQGSIEEPFSHQQIEETLIEISDRFQQESVRQWAKIKDNLLHYFIRNYPNQPGKYYLTDYAYSIIETMQNKLDNPYKQHPLKRSFELSFYLKFKEIQSIEDLERKFGRLFITGPKKIVIDHLAALEDELQEAYKTLNKILSDEKDNAVELVKKFAITFKKFGARAEDITGAMASKEKFLKDLQLVVDDFYAKVEETKFLDNNIVKDKAIKDWEKAKIIYTDIADFFKSIEAKISIVRRQINNASEKLSELQEYFSARANYRLQIQKMLRTVLDVAKYSEEGVIFEANFPLKKLVFERIRMLYLRHSDFDNKKPNMVIPVLTDERYEMIERNKIDNEVNRQKTINTWVNIGREKLEKQKGVSMDELMNTVLEAGEDLSIAYQVAAEMISLSSEEKDIFIDIEQKLVQLKQNEMALWQTKIRK